MSTMEATGAADVLADLDELDSVMGVETQDQQDLKPKQVCVRHLSRRYDVCRNNSRQVRVLRGVRT